MDAIVILNYNNYKSTEKCVKSIYETKIGLPLLIVIIDNGSRNDSLHILKKKYKDDPSIIVHGLSDNVGYANGNNVGIEIAKKHGCEYCILSNSDIVFENETINKLLLDIKTMEGTVIVGPRILSVEGEVQQSSRLRAKRYIDELGIGRLVKVKQIDEKKFEGISNVHSILGCCFAININMFIAMGGFDTNTFLYYEEDIFSIQASRNNYKILIDTSVSVIHEHGASSHGEGKTFFRNAYISSTLYYWKKYRGCGRIRLYIIGAVFYLKTLIRSARHKEINSGDVLKNIVSVLKKLEREELQ